MSTIWDNCEHEWGVVVDSQYHSETCTAVVCVKCQCPGEHDSDTGLVFWPAT